MAGNDGGRMEWMANRRERTASGGCLLRWGWEAKKNLFAK
jgi:hypothetical protein